MKSTNTTFILIQALLLVSFSSCLNDTSVAESDAGTKIRIENPVNEVTHEDQDLIADTIIYDVIIRNPNPDDKWAEESLKGLQQEKLVDSLFNLIYGKRIIPYDYFTGDVLKIKEIENLEAEDWFSRDKIGKIQFAEKWYFESSATNFPKEVISVSLGHELYDDSGEVRGYKPVFKLYLSQ